MHPTRSTQILSRVAAKAVPIHRYLTLIRQQLGERSIVPPCKSDTARVNVKDRRLIPGEIGHDKAGPDLTWRWQRLAQHQPTGTDHAHDRDAGWNPDLFQRLRRSIARGFQL